MHKPLRARFYSLSLTVGILGVLVSMFRYESIAYIGSRLAMILVLLTAFVWYISIAIYGLIKMPKEMRIQKNHERYLKYLPKKRKK
jgi:ABC-type anion transport system duplicated permease subunit